MSDLKIHRNLYDCTDQNQGRPNIINSEGYCVPLTKYEYGDTERSILENLNKKH